MRRNVERSALMMMALEPRWMFDGAAAVDAAHAAADASAKALIPDVPPAVQVRAADPSQDGGKKEVAFVDTSVAGYQVLIDGVRAGVEVQLIDGGSNGLAQMAKWAQTHSGYDAIHLLSHGAEGLVNIGATSVADGALGNPEIQAELAEIGHALKSGGDILLYGCDIAKGSDGDNFIRDLAAATGADVAASIDATGLAAQGGDWVLERSVGAVATTSIEISRFDGLLGTPTVTGTADATYASGGTAVAVDPAISFANGTHYGGGSISFTLSNVKTGDVLALSDGANVNDTGAISTGVVGSSTGVYLGNGTGRDLIGYVDSTNDGTNGKALQINLGVSPFTNAGFETGDTTGWTIVTTQVKLGTTDLASAIGSGGPYVTPADTTTPANNTNNDSVTPSSLGTLSGTVVTTQKTAGSYGLQLLSTGVSMAHGYDIIHGPLAISPEFAANAGDGVSFDWRALGGSDAFDVYAYLLNVTDGTTTLILDQTGSSGSASTSFAPGSVTVPTSDNYRLIFAAGTFDFSGGGAAGASLYLDNFRSYGSSVTDAVMTTLTSQITFKNTLSSPDTTTRILQISAKATDGNSGTATSNIKLTAPTSATTELHQSPPPPAAEPPKDAPKPPAATEISTPKIIKTGAAEGGTPIINALRGDGTSSDAKAAGMQTVVRESTTTQVSSSDGLSALSNRTSDGIAAPASTRGAESNIALSPNLSAPSDGGFRVAVAAPGAATGGDAIVVARPIGEVVQTGRVSFGIPADAFAVAKADAQVTLQATMADGQPLPGWLSFNPTTGRFEGTPPPGQTGAIDIRVSAKDAAGAEAVQVFKMEVRGQGANADGLVGPSRHAFVGKAGLAEQIRAAKSGTARLAAMRSASGRVA
ncbi:hypothetical protein CU669_19385 [Paramagnetospirillum kuznetsovii]|uniref:Dystroglycan-type cadherin-like domain-containing protein n=1 Tax=Paramagnetospirillum kuznetsovii TaxID=2053833 RepID=A0A364NT61_9PROT|nr:DUF4347 domain-containing protein [Paramagnetospirillum kuznetsovii]RAU20271.1 hypothetical protein CU669_19385 [Paramagnetospirillum kuznetsovii]